MFVDPSTSKIYQQSFDYFTAPVIEKLNYKDGLIDADPAEKFYSFKKILAFNGNVYLIESHSYSITGSHSNGVSSTDSYERELLVTKYNNSGKMEWMKIIPKFTVNNLNSFNCLINNGTIYLFYPEHPKNLEKSTVDNYDTKGYKEVKFFNGAAVVCTSISESGSVKRKQLFINEGWCYDPLPYDISLEENNGLIFKMINKEKERYDLINIK